MATLKTEIKVTINCSKCKSEVLKTVAKLSGVDEVSVDSAKGIVTVIGEVDPVCVTTQIRKTGKFAEIITVGPPKKPDSPKPEPKPEPLAHTCPHCQFTIFSYEPYDRVCSIL